MKNSAAAILAFFLLLLTVMGLGYFAKGFFPEETYNELINEYGLINQFRKLIQLIWPIQQLKKTVL